MAREPHYPDDARVGDAPGDEAGVSTPETGAAGQFPASNRARNIVAGAAIGIGSAALVAALLYANRSRKSGEQRPPRVDAED
jgi:hypothetical protein